MENKKLKVDIFSDYVCPFCYMGKRNLDRAIENLGIEDLVEINYRAYELDENADKNISIPKYDYLQETSDRPLGIIMAQTRDIIDEAKDMGLDYNYDIMVTSNTHNAHKLTKFAKSVGKEKEFAENIMDGYFNKGLNLNSEEELLNIVEKTELNVDDARDVLHSDKFEDEVAQDKYDAYQYQVQSVPFFLFDNRYGASGKQDVKVFEDALKQLAEFYEIEI